MPVWSRYGLYTECDRYVSWAPFRVSLCSRRPMASHPPGSAPSVAESSSGPGTATSSPDPARSSHSSKLAGAALKKKQELHECLRKLDPDGSGSISVALLADAMRQIGINFTLDGLSKELLSNDSDGDGNMEVHEVDQFLEQEAYLQRSGVEGALEPWSIGRSLALDALPLAARAYSAHTVVNDVINASQPPKKISRKDSSPALRRPSAGPRSTVTQDDSESVKGLPKGKSSHALPTELAPAAAAPAAAPAPVGRSLSSRRSISSLVDGDDEEVKEYKPRSAMFLLWEDTKATFGEYSKIRRQYEAAWPHDAWKIQRKAKRRTRALAPSASAPDVGFGALPAEGAMADIRESLSAVRREELRLLHNGLPARSTVRRKAEERRAIGAIGASLPPMSGTPHVPPAQNLHTQALLPTSAASLRTSSSSGLLTVQRRPSRQLTISETAAPAAPAATRPRFVQPPPEPVPPSRAAIALRKTVSASILVAGFNATTRPRPVEATTVVHRAVPDASSSSVKSEKKLRPVTTSPKPRRSVEPPRYSAVQRPTTSLALQSQDALKVGSLLLTADRKFDDRPSTGLSLSRHVHRPSKPPRHVQTIITTSHAAAADAQKRREEWGAFEEYLLFSEKDAPPPKSLLSLDSDDDSTYDALRAASR